MTSTNRINLDECIVYPSFIDWLLLPNSIKSIDDTFKLIHKNLEFCLYIKGQNNLTSINHSTNPEVTNFIFGNPTKRINTDQGSPFDFKGHFVIISFRKNSIIISNDHFGLNKFFYSVENRFIASNNICHILSFIENRSINRFAELSYLLYNYFVWGCTIFKSVKYSLPATIIEIESGYSTERSYYWKDVKQQLPINSKVKLEKEIADYWIEVIKGYGDNQNGTTLSLTGGYDSRMILAGLLENKKRVNCFTFGNPLSNDAVNATLISKILKIDHTIYPLDNDSKRKFLEDVKIIVKDSSGLLNILRILRLKYFKLSAKKYGDLYLGYSGSEILRGLFPDGLMTSLFYSETFSNPLLIDYRIKYHLQSFHYDFNLDDVNQLREFIISNSDYSGHFKHLIHDIIPLHFGEDIRWLNQQFIFTRTPFIDIDFFQKLLSFGCIPLLKSSENKIKKNHFSRINNPKLSARIICNLNSDLGHISLGKGYSPSDYIRSKYYAGIKLMIKKYTSKPQLVTEFDSWYPGFLIEYLSDNSVDLEGFDKKKVINSISKINGSSEINFLVPTKFLNLFLIKQEFKDKRNG